MREELITYWGGDWGCDSEVGTLRAVLLRRPGPEIEHVKDPEQYRWQDIMNPEKAREQHDALAAFYRLGNTHHTDLLEFNTFTGSDIRPVFYMPPNPQATDDRRLGYVEELGDVQTITISSHRPAIPARVLGNASPAGYGRSIRTYGLHNRGPST